MNFAGYEPTFGLRGVTFFVSALIYGFYEDLTFSTHTKPRLGDV
jgi:hypothetical protein